MQTEMSKKNRSAPGGKSMVEFDFNLSQILRWPTDR
jgi:hypothetical protein